MGFRMIYSLYNIGLGSRPPGSGFRGVENGETILKKFEVAILILYDILINNDVIIADLLARTTIFIIKLRLSTELGVERCGSDYNPVVQ